MLKTENFAFKIYPEKVVSIKETQAWGLLPKTPVLIIPGTAMNGVNCGCQGVIMKTLDKSHLLLF